MQFDTIQLTLPNSQQIGFKTFDHTNTDPFILLSAQGLTPSEIHLQTLENPKYGSTYYGKYFPGKQLVLMIGLNPLYNSGVDQISDLRKSIYTSLNGNNQIRLDVVENQTVKMGVDCRVSKLEPELFTNRPALQITLESESHIFSGGKIRLDSSSPLLADAGEESNRVNLVTNPSFEVDTSGWATDGGTTTITRTTTYSRSGSASALLSFAASAVETTKSHSVHYDDTNNSVSEGDFVYASIYTLAVGYGYNLPCALILEALDGSDQTVAVYKSSPFSAKDEWGRISVYGLMPATTESFRLSFQWLPVANQFGTIETDMFIDDAIVEISNVLLPYFDGSTTDTSSRSYSWSGTQDLSTSVENSDSGYADILNDGSSDIGVNLSITLTEQTDSISFSIDGDILATIDFPEELIPLTNGLIVNYSSTIDKSFVQGFYSGLGSGLYLEAHLRGIEKYIKVPPGEHTLGVVCNGFKWNFLEYTPAYWGV